MPLRACCKELVTLSDMMGVQAVHQQQGSRYFPSAAQLLQGNNKLLPGKRPLHRLGVRCFLSTFKSLLLYCPIAIQQHLDTQVGIC